jgi:hypothetical protein
MSNPIRKASRPVFRKHLRERSLPLMPANIAQSKKSARRHPLWKTLRKPLPEV